MYCMFVSRRHHQVDVKPSGGWSDPRQWVTGNYTWCKALYYMGGGALLLAVVGRRVARATALWAHMCGTYDATVCFSNRPMFLAYVPGVRNVSSEKC
jgi:hypothetical protein